ncbi:hypothetical protein SPI_07216 [Niveomyces insectorum RCEF 264]|uniref:Uncharacterized protein n=1 Tax=Niveomyces insectorum RCEF 264 TaxID=1081102 RepID=A0A167QE39_9HYPO|nr:hypothetical protein SPI_07216 [Niveomyces insectorum RCEF 264]
MALALLYGAALFGAAAEAVIFKQPQATGLPDIPGDAFNPVPTPGPEVKELVRRAASSPTTVFYAQDNTCGYLSGFSSQAYTCNDLVAQCAIITVSSLGYIGCCDDGQCGGFHLNCVDNAQFSSSKCNSDCLSDTFTLKCTDTETPYCNTVSINGGASLQVWGYYCDETPTLGAQLVLHPDLWRRRRHHSTTPPTPPPTPTPTPAPHKTNVGAIAGGTVGGVAGVALLGVLGFFIYRRKRKDVSTQGPVANPGAAGAAGTAGGPGGPGGPGVAAYGVPPANGDMSQVGTPPPPGLVGGYPVDPTKVAYANYSQQSPPLNPDGSPVVPYGSPQANQPPYFAQNQQQPPPQQQQQYPPQPYYAAAAVAPDRNDSASPSSPGYDNRVSSISTGTDPHYLSPQTTGTSATGSGVVGGVPAGQPQVPPTIHEAGGIPLGTPANLQSDHHGEMHELA